MHSIFSYWHFDFATTVFIILLCLFYLYAINLKLKKQSLYFFSGIIFLIISISSPLNFIGENYLFSFHMISHVLIILIATPLMVAGIPQENKFEKSLLLLSKKILRFPFLSWFIGVSMMWVWHIPYLFNQMFFMHGMHHTMNSMSASMYIQMLSLLFAGIIFCWPIINPFEQYRIAPITGVLYLSTACVFCSLLGLLITFAPVGTYTPYLNIIDYYGYLPMIRNRWEISTAIDQQMGGLIMWVPCCIIYLTASMVLLIKWFDGKNANRVHEIKMV